MDGDFVYGFIVLAELLGLGVAGSIIVRLIELKDLREARRGQRRYRLFMRRYKEKVDEED
jgi:hypothetical protein